MKNVYKKVICFDNLVSFYKVISASSGLQSPRDRLHAMAFDLAQRYSPSMGLELICRGMRGKKKRFWSCWTK